MKYSYHIAIIDPATNQLAFVTSVDYATRTTMWEAGKPAKGFNKSIADDLLYGLIYNGYKAVVVKAPAHYELSN